MYMTSPSNDAAVDAVGVSSNFRLSLSTVRASAETLIDMIHIEAIFV